MLYCHPGPPAYGPAAVVALMQNREEDLIAGDLRSLDAGALGAVYDRYASTVFRYVRYRLGDDTLAEDLAGEVFLSLLEAFRRGGGPRSNVKGWLLSTANHMVTDHIRRSYRRPLEALSDDHPDPTPLPGDEFERREQTRRFRAAYAGLTPEQQQVLALRFGDGFSLEETAEVINRNVNAVKALQFRAMQALQRNIGKMDNDAA